MYDTKHLKYAKTALASQEKPCFIMMNSQLFISKIRCSTVLLPNWAEKSDYVINDHVDVWRIPVQRAKDSLESVLEFLNPLEIEKMKRFKKENERMHYAIGKGFLKFLLTKYLRCSPMDIEIGYGRNDKPFLKNIRGMYYNVSHSHDWIIIGFCKEEIGVDIEFIDSEKDFLSLIHKYFTGPETNFIERSYSPRHEFFKLWTRKESLLKATSLDMAEKLTIINCLDGIQYIPYEVGGGFTDWKIKSLLMDELYIVSISFPVHLRKIRFFNAAL